MGSRNTDYLADTQDEEQDEDTQQDIFTDEDQGRNREQDATQNGIVVIFLREIIKEQRALTKKVDELCSAQQKFIVEGSAVERDFISFLKDRFSDKPWVTSDDLQGEIRQLLSRAGVTGRGAIQCMHTYAYTKFTQYRNQLRGKLLANGDKDVEGMSIDSLHGYLWRHFLPPSINVENEVKKRLTLMLRSFTSKRQYFRKAGGAPAFWKEFKQFFTDVNEDSRPTKWVRLEEKETKKVEAYKRTQS